jgi:hypothetical protein
MLAAYKLAISRAIFDALRAIRPGIEVNDFSDQPRLGCPLGTAFDEHRLLLILHLRSRYAVRLVYGSINRR